MEPNLATACWAKVGGGRGKAALFGNERVLGRLNGPYREDVTDDDFAALVYIVPCRAST